MIKKPCTHTNTMVNTVENLSLFQNLSICTEQGMDLFLDQEFKIKLDVTSFTPKKKKEKIETMHLKSWDLILFLMLKA